MQNGLEQKNPGVQDEFDSSYMHPTNVNQVLNQYYDIPQFIVNMFKILGNRCLFGFSAYNSKMFD